MADLKTAFQNLQASVAEQKTVDASVLALVQGLTTKLDALASQETIDPADIQALSDTLTAEQKNLSFAVTQGTGTPAALGTPANPIFSTAPVITGSAITTDPVAPIIPVVVDAPDAGSTDTVIDASSSLPSTPTSDVVTEPTVPVVEVAVIDHSAEGQATMSTDLNAEGSQL